MDIENSARLGYQLIDESDSEFLFQLDQDPEVMRYINGGKMTTREEIKALSIPRLNSYKNPEKAWGLWKVTVLETQQEIGWILVRPMDFFSDKPLWHDIELGWRFFQATWGQGYASEAAIQIQCALAKQAENKFFSAVAMHDNDGSIGVMKKMGMEYIKSYIHSDSQLGDSAAVLYRMANT
tara:strand:- start:3152 stop:3694 length:543 start_codon:yes stop_codon:yes gene_type:complete